MYNPFELQFTLKQHTPIIHFQHDQEGATLRASEVKPRFMDFLMNDLERVDNVSYKKYKSLIYAINTDEQVLPSPFKMIIQAQGEADYYVFNAFVAQNNHRQEERQLQNALQLPNLKLIAPSAFFSNTEKISKEQWREMKVGVIHTKGIKIQIHCFLPEWLELVKDTFPLFVACVNFGNRNNKGFGCFYVEGFDPNKALVAVLKYYRKTMRMALHDTSIQAIAKKIDTIYKDFKNNGGTKQSALRDIYKENSVEWEKNIIKDNLVTNSNVIHDYTNNPRIKYVRALFGLAELYDYPKNSNIKIKIKDPNPNSDTAITRFKSPITFKIIDDKLYLLFSDIPDYMLNKAFFFEKDTNNSLLISTPPSVPWADIYNYFTSIGFKGLSITQKK